MLRYYLIVYHMKLTGVLITWEAGTVLVFTSVTGSGFDSCSLGTLLFVGSVSPEYQLCATHCARHWEETQIKRN